MARRREAALFLRFTMGNLAREFVQISFEDVSAEPGKFISRRVFLSMDIIDCIYTGHAETISLPSSDESGIGLFFEKRSAKFIPFFSTFNTSQCFNLNKYRN